MIGFRDDDEHIDVGKYLEYREKEYNDMEDRSSKSSSMRNDRNGISPPYRHIISATASPECLVYKKIQE